MSHRQLLISVAIGVLSALPACAQDKDDDQIIGPPPTIGCCWGYAPDQSQEPAVVTVSWSGYIGAFPNGGGMN